jgi:hypothetical protein
MTLGEDQGVAGQSGGRPPAGAWGTRQGEVVGVTCQGSGLLLRQRPAGGFRKGPG